MVRSEYDAPARGERGAESILPPSVGAKGTMECKEFLEGYSSYLDGLVDDERRRAFRDHIERCDSCARYDRVVQRGLKAFRNLPRLDPSPDFLPRLRHRLYHVQDEIPFQSARHGGSAALLAVAAVGLLALAWLPFASQVPVEVQLPEVAVERPASPDGGSVPSLFDRGPFVTPAAGVESWSDREPGEWEGASLFEGGSAGPAGAATLLSVTYPSPLTRRFGSASR